MLKLKVESIEDLKILSACVQNAKFKLNAVSFQEEGHSFILMLDRYCWEKDNGSEGQSFRTLSALHIEYAKTYELLIEKEKAKDFLFEILSLHFKDNIVFLHCVDRSVISVKVDQLKLFLRDIEDAKPTDVRPNADLVLKKEP